jgi:hypothetical protein
MARSAARPAHVALALAMAAAGLFAFLRGRDLTFYVDEWDYLLHRRGHGPDTFLDPQNGHLQAVPMLVYKGLIETVGADSYVPYRLAAIAVVLAGAALFYVYVRRRVGETMALAATIVVLFFGPGWEPLTAPVGMVALISLAAGLGMLLALDAGTRRGDVAAAVLLGVSLASFSYGPCFAAAAAVDVLLRPGARRRIWLVGAPVALYALWALGYGESEIDWGNLPGAPRSVAESASAVAVGLTGLYRKSGDLGPSVSFDSTFGPPLAFALVAVVAYRLRGPARSSPGLWTTVVLTLTFWASVALVQNPGRTPDASRYVYPGAVFVLLVCAELLKDYRPGRRGMAVLAAWTVVLLVVGIPNLRYGADALENLARFDRAELAALELARPEVAPEFQPEAVPSPVVRGHYLQNVSAKSYFNAVDDFGSPAYSIGELQRAPALPRQAADLVLASATGLAARPGAGRSPGAAAPVLEVSRGVKAEPTGSCLRLRPDGASAGRADLRLPPGGLLVHGAEAGALDVSLRRFGDDFAVAVAGVSGNSPWIVPIRGDAAGVPWRARLDNIRGPVVACGA